MGQLAALTRGQRFIDEFNEDAQRFAIKAACITSTGLGFDDLFNVVRLYHGIRVDDGSEVEVTYDGIIYDPARTTTR